MAVLASRPWHLGMAAVALGLGVSTGPAWLAPALAAAGAAVAVALRAGAGPGLLVVPVLLLAGASAGQARIEAVDRPGAGLREGQLIEGSAYLLGRPRPGPFGSSAEVVLTRGPHRGVRLLARTRSLGWPRGAGPGAELRLSGSFGRPPPPRDGGFDFAAHLRRRGVAGELELSELRATGRRRGGPAGAVDSMRRRAEGVIGAGLGGRDEALVLGMVLGEDERIDAATRDDWRASGLGHLLAVSGQNVMLLCALALPLLALLGLGRVGRSAALLGLIAVYVPLAGAGPSLQRAGVMGAAGIVALTASRPSSRWYALLLAAAVTLLVNPRACGDAGWQLSFAAVAGILCLGPPLRRALSFAPRPLAEGAAITVAATVATAPLVAHHFGSIPLAGLPANLLALPAVAPVMWLGMAAAALAQLGSLAEPAGALAAHLAGPPVRYLAWLAERAAEAPGGQLALPLGGPASVALAYAALVAGVLAARRVAGRSGPRVAEGLAAWRRLPRGRRAVVLGAAGCLLALPLWRAYRVPAPPAELTVSFLDVGQGDATLVQHPDGTAVLFDGGPPEARVERLLRRAGVRRLALVVATHQSRDHQGGLAEVVERYPVGLFLDGGDGNPDPGFRALQEEVDRRGIRRVRAYAPLEVAVGRLRIRVLSPDPRAPGEPPPEDPNPRAVVAVVSAGRFDLLLSGDAESEALLPLELPDVDAMKVPHHGSADPGLPEVLERVRPEAAAIEVGEGNTYGHPAPSTLAALRAAGLSPYRTDRHGTVRLSEAGDGLRVQTER